MQNVYRCIADYIMINDTRCKHIAINIDKSITGGTVSFNPYSGKKVFFLLWVYNVYYTYSSRLNLLIGNIGLNVF